MGNKGGSRRRRLAGLPIPFKDGLLTEAEYERRMAVTTTAELSKLFFSKEFEAWQRRKSSGTETTASTNTTRVPGRMAPLWLFSVASSILVISGLYSAYGKSMLSWQPLRAPLISLPLLASMASSATHKQIDPPVAKKDDICTEGEMCGVVPKEYETPLGDNGDCGSGCAELLESERIKELEEALNFESQVAQAWKCVVVMLMSTWVLKALWAWVTEKIPQLVLRAMSGEKKKG